MSGCPWPPHPHPSPSLCCSRWICVSRDTQEDGFQPLTLSTCPTAPAPTVSLLPHLFESQVGTILLSCNSPGRTRHTSWRKLWGRPSHSRRILGPQRVTNGPQLLAVGKTHQDRWRLCQGCACVAHWQLLQVKLLATIGKCLLPHRQPPYKYFFLPFVTLTEVSVLSTDFDNGQVFKSFLLKM